jgi:uncharacterized FlaG/YvyC family protein
MQEMITPINPISVSPVSGAADIKAPRAVADSAVPATPEVRKAEPQKTDEPERKAHVPGSVKQAVPAYDLRLTVDKDPETGEVVYKSINRLTGEIVSQMPNAEVMAMKRRESYGTGAIIITDV